MSQARRVIVVALLGSLVLGIASCGDDQPAPSEIEVPEWAKVAPEQIAEAKRHGVPVAFENDLGMRFVLIPAGTFLMGSPHTETKRDDDERQHRVELTRPYYLQITEVTNRHYRESERAHVSPPAFDGENQPVVNASWEDAREFAEWLSGRERGRTYDLPTEAQWEWACRAGTTTPFSFGETITTEQANHNGNSVYGGGRRGINRERTVDAGTLGRNAWGLYDMHGNVAEWCVDVYEPYPDAEGRMVTGQAGTGTGSARVLRGGSWFDEPGFVRSAARAGLDPGLRNDVSGFRLVSPLPAGGE